MKKILSCLLVTSVAVALVACGKNDVPEVPVETEEHIEQILETEPAKPIIPLPTFEELPVEVDEMFDGSERQIFTTGYGSLQDVTDKLINFQKDGLYSARTTAVIAEDGLFVNAHHGYARKSSYITFEDVDTGSWLSMTVSNSTDSFSDVNGFSLTLSGESAIGETELAFVSDMLTSVFGETGYFLVNGQDMDGKFIYEDEEDARDIPEGEIEECIALGDNVECYLRKEWLNEKTLIIDCMFSSTANLDTLAIDLTTDEMDISFALEDIYNLPTITQENVFDEYKDIVSSSKEVLCAHVAELVKLRQDDCDLARVGLALVRENNSYIDLKLTTAVYNTGDIVLAVKAQSYSEFENHMILDDENPEEHTHEENLSTEENDDAYDGPRDIPLDEALAMPHPVVEEIVEPQPYMTKQEFAHMILDVLLHVLVNGRAEYDGQDTIVVQCTILDKEYSTTLLITSDDAYNFYLNRI